jgi:hypothetical protein
MISDLETSPRVRGRPRDVVAMVGDHEYWFVDGDLCCLECIIISTEDVQESPAEQLDKAVTGRGTIEACIVSGVL